ncbi:MAG: hypothetical protein V3W17_09195 [Desulfobacteria bacterium]
MEKRKGSKIQTEKLDRGLGGPLIPRPYFKIAVENGKFFGLQF